MIFMPPKLESGFLGLGKQQGALFLIPPKRITTPPALILVRNVLTDDFGAFAVSVFLHDPQKPLNDRTEEDVRQYANMMREDGIFQQTAIYVNAQDCDPETILLTESAGLRTLHVCLDDRLPTTEDIARNAIIEILKAL